MSCVEFKTGERVVLCEPELALPMHRHADARIIVVLSGTVREIDIDGRHTYAAGDMIFRPPFFLHANAMGDAQTRYARLSLSTAGLRRLIDASGWRSERSRAGIGPDQAEALARTPFGGDELIDEFPQQGARKSPDGLSPFDELADELRQAKAESAMFFHTARKIGLEPYQLTRKFTAKRGFSPRSYRLEARLQRALRLLLQGGETIAQVSAHCGFSDQSHLTRTMVAATGLTPRKFRLRFSS